MAKCTIKLIGCDAETEIEIELSANELRLLQDIERKINEASSYGCEPTMSVRKVLTQTK